MAADLALRLDQAVVDQSTEGRQAVVGRPLAWIGEHVARGGRAEAADEDGQPGERAPLGRLEQVMAPGDGGRQGTLAVGDVYRSLGQCREPILQALQQRDGRQYLRLRGAELNREGQAVQPAADLGNRLELSIAGVRVRPDRTSALEEERHRFDLAKAASGQPGRWPLEWPNRVLLLASEVQRNAAGHDNPEGLTRGQQGTHRIAGRQKVLEVVQDEQRLVLAEPMA
ncbi:MAG: hypothetical protein ACRDLA_15025 [Thermoleophilaceae bacterium]